MIPATVFVTRAIPEEGLQSLRRHCRVLVSPQDAPISRQDLLQGASHADALICMLTDRVDRELLQAAPRLKIAANYAVGAENIDLQACRDAGVQASNTPGVLSDATADLAMGLLLDAARGISSGDRAMRRGEFKGWGPLYRLGREVSGKTLGLVGYGRIGRAMACRARGFNMRILYTQRHPLPDAGNALFRPLDELLAASDFVSLHCPLTQATRHLIGPRELGLLKPGAILINTARGPVVDEAALLQSLREGKLGGAGLDVFEREPQFEQGLAELDNVVLAPHLGSATRETREAMALCVVDNVLAALRGEIPKNSLL